MYFEIWKDDNLIKRGTDLLSTPSWEIELMQAPSMDLTLPIDYLEYLDGREEFKLFVNGKVFWGIVWDIELNKEEETMDISLRHVISEWEYRQISVNHAMQDKNLNVVYEGDRVIRKKSTGEAITASNFSIFAKSVKNMTDKKLIELAYASAWSLSNGDKVPITSVEHKLKKKEGTYKVRFATAKDTHITVECTVKTKVTYGGEKRNSSRANNETIQATRFDIDVDAAEGLDNDDLLKLVKPKAWVRYKKKQTVPVVRCTCEPPFSAFKGSYRVTVYTARGTSVWVTIKVIDEGVTPLPDPAIADKIEDIYNNYNFAYPGWEIEMQDTSGSEMIDYVYSRQNKLEALTKTMELTKDLFWRVGNINQKLVQIGKFGEKKPYVVSLKPSSKNNIRIITEPTIDYDFENVINVATVYSEKADSGMSTLTLREVYNGEVDQDENFPVVILHENANNERDYAQYVTQFPELAPNNELEYAVLDVESIALESGHLIEGTFAFDDLSPFQTDSRRIRNNKRRRAAEKAYHAAIRKLKQSRRSYDIEVTVEEIPTDIWVGDRVRFRYDNSLFKLDACSNYWKKILQKDDWFYVTKISYDIDENGGETNQLTLTKWIKIDRETSNE